MRKIALVLLVLLVAAPLAMAKGKAQAAPDTTMSVGPFFQAHYNSGLSEKWAVGGGVKFQYWFMPELAAEARLSGLVATESEDDSTVVPIEAGVVYRLPIDSPALPYFGAGLGYYYIDVDTDVDYDNPFGFYVLAGIDFKLAASAKIFLEIKYTRAVEEYEYKRSGYSYRYSYSSEYGLDGPAGILGVAWSF